MATEQLKLPIATPGDRAYIAGPMSDIPYNNFEAFDECAAYLRPLGVAVFNPAEEDRKNGWKPKPDGDITGFDRAAALKVDFLAIIRWATCIVMLPGWENSEGAKAERIVAEQTGKDVLLYDPEAKEGWRLTPAPKWNWANRDITHDMLISGEWAAKPDEVRTTSATGGEKGVKLARYDLIPARPLRLLAELYGKGCEKYDARNWERGYEWSKSHGAKERHSWLFWEGEDYDFETQVPHLINEAWHCFALVEFMLTHPEYDDRPHKVLDQPVDSDKSVSSVKSHDERPMGSDTVTWGS